MSLSPDKNCALCPRLAAFRCQNRLEYPAFHNAPVPSIGGLDARLLIVGLAPGLKGANATGRPFTGDYAGIILYAALLKHGLITPPPIGGRKGGGHGWREQSKYAPHLTSPLWGEEFILHDTRITNAVRCVPPENKPETSEIKTCNGFLKNEIAAMPNLKVILSLGQISHNAVLKALGQKPSAAKFAHGAIHSVGTPAILLLNSYHTSRYNINVGTLTVRMFDEIIVTAKRLIETRG